VVNNAAPGSAPVDLRVTLPGRSTIRSTGVFQTSATKDLAAISRPRYRGWSRRRGPCPLAERDHLHVRRRLILTTGSSGQRPTRSGRVVAVAAIETGDS
jgi:hypothetical protein